jgi:hypothetical protein
MMADAGPEVGRTYIAVEERGIGFDDALQLRVVLGLPQRLAHLHHLDVRGLIAVLDEG